MTDYRDEAIAPETSIEEFRKIVESRRSVRRFTDAPVPDEVVEDCLDLAMLAPNSSNLQPWEFYVVRDPQVNPWGPSSCGNPRFPRGVGESWISSGRASRGGVLGVLVPAQGAPGRPRISTGSGAR